jgi:hypothetical protein
MKRTLLLTTALIALYLSAAFADGIVLIADGGEGVGVVLGACLTNSVRRRFSFAVAAVAPDLCVPLPAGPCEHPFATRSRSTCNP